MSNREELIQAEMAHGPDTDELLRRMADLQNNTLDIHNLNITSLPILPSSLERLHCSQTPITSLPMLPSDLTELYCWNTPITSLPPLPSSLKILSCRNTQITSLPILPSNLKRLYCSHTPITSLPILPSGLEELWCWNTQITSLPELPSSLKELYCSNTPLLLQRGENESIKDYNARWRVLREELASKNRCQERCQIIKEELIMEVMHPRRIDTFFWRWVIGRHWNAFRKIEKNHKI